MKISMILAFILTILIGLVLSIVDVPWPEETRDYTHLTEKPWVIPIDGVYKEYFEKEWKEYAKTNIKGGK